MSQPEKFIVQGFNSLRIYCKITPTETYGKSEKNYTISFGGKDVFCFTAAIKADNPTICYIDRVEYNNACAVDGTLKERGNTVQLVRLALWTIVTKFPQVSTVTLIDDSYIYCNGENTGVKLSLSYDSILKYNQTWYQRNFAAELPADIKTKFENALTILDKPLESFEFMSTRTSILDPYAEFYRTSNRRDTSTDASACCTPRKFLQNLRKHFGANYCFEVGPWLEQYMTLIGVPIFKDAWFIRKENIIFPPNYTIVKTTNSIRGGSTRRQEKRKNFAMISHRSFGGWNNVDY
jgi:hypothetical protein